MKVAKVLFCILLFSQIAYGFPYRFERFILTDPSNRIVKKSIDIFYDTHIDLRHPKKRFLWAMLPERGPEYTYVERTLANVLRKLELFARRNPQVDRLGRKQKIDLVWELKKEIIDQEQKGEQADPGFIQRIGGLFGVEFAEEKNKFIRFVPADTYRGDRDSFFDIADAGDERLMSVDQFREQILQTLKELKVQDIIDWINLIIVQGYNDLLSIKKFGLNSLFFKVEKLWNDYSARLEAIKKKYLEPAKDKNALTIAKGPFIEEWVELFVDQAANMEMLIKSLSSPNKRVILYVGGDHGNWIGNVLEQKLNFKKVIDIGIKTEYAEKLPGAHLSSAAIKFLLKPPRANQPKIHKNISEPVINELNTLEQLWQDPSKKMSESLFLKKINKLLQQGRDAYIDFVNLQIGPHDFALPALVRGGMIQGYILFNPTLLHLAVDRGFEEAVKKLLSIPFISLDIQSDRGTPLYIAVKKYNELSGTKKDKMKNIIRLLLSAGANPNIPSREPDFDTVLHRAVANDDVELAMLLIQNGAEVNAQIVNPDNPMYGGDTPLHEAKSAEMVKLLLRNGARADIKNNQGQIPSEVHYDDQIIKLLEAKSQQ